MTFEEWLLRLKDFDSDRYELIRSMLKQEQEAQELLHKSSIEIGIVNARCHHEQIVNLSCELCGMDFS